MKCTGFALLLLVLITAAAAAQEGEIDIVVVGPDDKGLEGVAVTVTAGDGSVAAEGTTNKKGRFKSRLPEAGSYRLELEKSGLATVTQDLDVEAGTLMSGTVKMWDQETWDKSQAVEAFNAAVGAIQSGNATEALEKFERAAELDPDLAEAHRLVAALNLEAGNLEAAAPALARYVELKGLDEQIAEVAYAVYREQGERKSMQEAMELLKQSGRAADAAIRVFNEGVEANQAKDVESALVAFSDAAELDPSLAPAHQSLAAIAFNEQDYATALTHLERLLSLEPEHRAGLRMSFYANAFSGKREAAAAAGKTWVGLDSGATGEILEEAEQLFEEDQVEQAQLLSELLLGADPEFPRGHYLAGRVLAAAGEVAEAKEHLKHFIDMAPSDPEAAAAKQMLAGL